MRSNLRIEEYFRQLDEVIINCAVVQSFNVTYDKRASHEGFIRGEIFFMDGSRLQFREFVDVEIIIDRLMYVYHYGDSVNNLLFRYDNTGHHKSANLSTYPHHKHERSEQNVIASFAPELAEVLREIETSILLSKE